MELNGFGFLYWWMPIAAAASILITIVVLVVRRRRRAAEAPTGRPIAHADRVTALPSYRRALRRYRTLLAALAAAAAVLLLAGVGIAARPAVTGLFFPTLNTRDIVLCLDVSGSMVEYDAQVVDRFSELVDEFDGERISLVVFNASAVTYFPLTSDYGYVQAQFQRLQDQFASEELDYFDGTFFGDGSSLVGDGLASCAQRFDASEDERSRSIVLATDNLVIGTPIFTLPEAGELAQSRGIRVYGINPGDADAKDYLPGLADEYRTVMERTGGGYFRADDPSAVPDIVADITAQQAVALEGTPRRVALDVPGVPIAIGFIALGLLLVVARRLDR